MKEIIIERLKRKDASLMEKAFRKAIKEDFNYYPKKAEDEFLSIWNENFFRKIKPIFVAAKTDNEIVGFAIGKQQWVGSGVGIIHWLWVDKRFRGQGIGKKIFEKIEEIFIEKGHHRIELEADNPKTWEIYLKFGFKDRHFQKNNFWHLDEYIYSKEIGMKNEITA